MHVNKCDHALIGGATQATYPYFARTWPNEAAQAQATVDLISNFQWAQVSIIFRDDAWGASTVSRLTTIAAAANVRIAATAGCPGTLSAPYTSLIAKLNTTREESTNVYVSFVWTAEYAALFSAAGTAGLIRPGAAWIANDEVRGAVASTPVGVLGIAAPILSSSWYSAFSAHTVGADASIGPTVAAHATDAVTALARALSRAVTNSNTALTATGGEIVWMLNGCSVDLICHCRESGPG